MKIPFPNFMDFACFCGNNVCAFSLPGAHLTPYSLKGKIQVCILMLGDIYHQGLWVLPDETGVALFMNESSLRLG